MGNSELQRLIENEFPINTRITYLNHAGVGPWPARTAEALRQFAEENISHGASRYPEWLRTETDLKNAVCRLINAPSANDIALVKNTSEGLSLVAYGLSWKRGDNIIITDHEFPSNRIVWESLARFGVETRIVNLQAPDTATQDILRHVDSKTRLISVSSVQYASGLVMDLEFIGRFCREHNVLFCVDAIQSIGALPMDVREIHADFVIADGHKWMLGPEGIGIFYSTPESREKLNLSQFGWHMIEQSGNYEMSRWEIASGARRFECGSPNMLGIHALNASLSLILDVGMDTISREIIKKTRYIIEFINNNKNYYLISWVRQGLVAGIVTFGHHSIPATELLNRLVEEDIYAANRGGGVRFSPHFYTPDERIDDVLNTLDKYS